MKLTRGRHSLVVAPGQEPSRYSRANSEFQFCAVGVAAYALCEWQIWQRRIAAQNPSIFRSNSELGSTNSKLGSTNSGDRCQVGRQVRIATWVGRIAGANSKSPGCGPGTSFALTLLRIVRTGSDVGRTRLHRRLRCRGRSAALADQGPRRGSWVGLVRSITSTAIELTSQSISGPRRGENSSRASPRVCAERSDAADLGEEAVPGLRR